jgi:hypothetical protein
MVIRTGPNEPHPTHHVKLTDGVSSVGLILSDRSGNANPNAFERLPLPRTGIKMYTGEAQYSDQEMPWSTKQQEDFSGGRGSEDLDEAANQFYDSQAAETMIAGKVSIGGQEVPTTGDYISSVQYWPHQDGGLNIVWNWTKLRTTTTYLAMKVIPSANFTAAYCHIVLRKRGTPTGSFNLKIHSDNSGAPGTQLALYTIAVGSHPDLMSVVVKCPISQALTGSTTYWLVAIGNSADTTSDCWEILTVWNSLSAVGKTSGNGTAWTSYAYDMVYRCTSSIDAYKPIFFIYKGSLFCAFSYSHNTAAKLYINGDMGLATGAGSGNNTLADTGKSWTADELKGSICVLRWGTGAAAERNYSRISGNTDKALTVEDDWEVKPSTDTEYSVIASDKWTEVTGHGLKRVTDVLVWNNNCFFACGNLDDMRTMRVWNNSGTWTWTFATHGGKAEYLVGQGSGELATIWKGERGDSTINYADATDEGTALTWSGDLVVGDSSERLNGMCVYGDENVLYCGKDGSIYKIVNDAGTYKPIKLNMDEMASVMDGRNCAAMLHHNAYLYFSLHDTLERYYESAMDDVNPGLKPKAKRGPVVALAGFPNRLLAAIDNTDNDRGYIMAHTGGGWHSVYDGYDASRVRGMFVQTIPGENADRLWFNSGIDLCWLPIAINSAQHIQQDFNFFNYRWESSIETSRIYMHLKALDKFWHELNIEADYPDVDTWIEVDYRTEDDAEGAWHYLGSFSSSTTLASFPSLTSRWLQLRVRLLTNNNDFTPVLRALITEALVKLAINWQTTLSVRLADRDQDLNGEMDEATMDAKLNQLETWISAPTKLTMTSVRSRLDSRAVFLDAQSLAALGIVQDMSTERYLFQVTLYDA